MNAATQEPTKSVVDYLSTLIWDGVPRLDRWLIEYAGAEDTPHVRAVGRLMLVAAVRRARVPGCRFEQMPVFVGPQGCGKSEALRVLAVEDVWFTDVLPLTDGAVPREIIEATDGKWLVEAAELANLLESDSDDKVDRESAPRRQSFSLKAFLSRTHDEARLAYQRTPSRIPRQFVVVGTTSASDYLVDVAGNRRIVAVQVKHFDLGRLRAVRDQLWAEAGIVEAAGGSLHLLDATAPS